jgi:hypothetical protein
MLNEVGHTVHTVELFNYSLYGQQVLQGRDVENFWKTVAEPTLREYLLTLSTRGNTTTPIRPAQNWETLVQETEPHWVAISESTFGNSPADLVDREMVLASIERRYAELSAENRELNSAFEAEVGLRDRTIANVYSDVAGRDKKIAQLNAEIGRLNDRLGALQGAYDAKISERIKTVWSRMMSKRRSQ